MMTPARLLAPLLIPNATLPLRDERGNLKGTISYKAILAYIRLGIVVGIGSKTRVRFIQLTSSKQVMKDEAECDPIGRITSSDASVTVYREPVRDENGNVFARIWMHKHARL